MITLKTTNSRLLERPFMAQSAQSMCTARGRVEAQVDDGLMI
jgi:hypothetical protein